MGNYYEGTLSIPLKKDIPHELRIALIEMCYWQEEMNKIPNKWKDEPIFKNDRFDRIRFEYGFVLKIDDEFETLEYEGEDLCDKSLYDEDFWKKLDGYFLKANFCFKGYKNVGEELVDFLKPYMDTRFNYLGNIKDEDGYYNKDFFIDDTEFKKEQEKRLKVCEGCEDRKETCFCENYYLCERAYLRGVNSIKD